MKFEDFIGLDLTTLSLRSYLKTLASPKTRQRPILFTGPTGSGKTALSEAFHEAWADSLMVSYPATQVDWEDLYGASQVDAPKVFLIESVDSLTDADEFLVAASKIETQVQWLFTARSEVNVPVPIKARSVVFRMLPLDPEILRQRASERVAVPEDVETLVRRSEGFVGLLDREIDSYLASGGFTVLPESHIYRLAAALVRGDRSSVAALTNDYLTQYGAADVLVAELEDFFSDVLVTQSGGDPRHGFSSKVAPILSETRLLSLVKVLWQVQDRIGTSNSPATTARAGLLMIAAAMAPATEQQAEPEVPEPEDRPMSASDVRQFLEQQGLA